MRKLPKPLSPLLLEWSEDLHAEGLSKHTRFAYVVDLQEVEAFLGGNLEGVTREDLFTYRRSLSARDLAVATCARRLTAVRTFYEWLRRKRNAVMSPAHDLKSPKRPENIHRWWTQEQVAQFRAAFTGADPATVRDRAMCELGLVGLRVSEVLALDRNDVQNLEHPSRASIRVHRKGNKEQILPLSEDARAALLAWMTMRPDVSTDALFFRMPFQPSRRDRLHYASVEKIFRQYAACAGLPLRARSNFHLLRHSTAQRLADLGTNMQDIQAVLGHRSPKTTMIYFRVSDAALRKTVNRLNYNEPNEGGS